MKPFSSNLFRVASLALALPIIGMCGSVSAVQINGICINQSSCVTPTPVSYGGTTDTGTTSTGVVLNTDSFNVSTAFAVGTSSGGGTFIDFYPTATYIGLSPSVGTETLTIDLFASIYDASATNWNGVYTEHIPFIVTNDSNAYGQLFVDGQGVGKIGPDVGAGSFFGPGQFKSASLTGIDGNTLNYDFQIVYTFTPGVTTGGFDSSPAVPEPAQIIPAGLSLIGFALVALRRRKQ